MGKEHCGKETDTGYGKREDKRECTLTLNCRKTHESGDKGDVHGDLLCVDFAGCNYEDYNYDLVIKDYESCLMVIPQRATTHHYHRVQG